MNTTVVSLLLINQHNKILRQDRQKAIIGEQPIGKNGGMMKMDEGDEQSIVDDFRGPTHIRGDITERLDGSHVGDEVAVLITEEVVVPGAIDEGEATDPALRQHAVEYPGLSLIEVVVNHSEGDVLEVGGAEELPQTHVDPCGDGEGGVGAALPPVAAHEAEGEDEQAPPDHRAHQTQHAHGLHLHPGSSHGGIDELFAVGVSEAFHSALEREGVSREHEDVGVHHHAHAHPHPAHHRVHLDHRRLTVHTWLTVHRSFIILKTDR